MIPDFDRFKAFMDDKVLEFNRPDFIVDDPVSIPHLFSKKQDIEIAGFFSAILAWGQRKTIINKCLFLMEMMDHAPYEFIKNHEENDLKRLLTFKHRTFNDTDLLYFISFLNHHYRNSNTLEDAFLIGANFSPFRDDFFDDHGALKSGEIPVETETYRSSACMLSDFNDSLSNPSFSIERALINFRHYFFSLPDFPQRTQKHISSPLKKSTCKRLNMFLRWMVRQDDKGVDFGIWKNISPALLICPFDVHVERVGRRLALVQRKQNDWNTALELTENLRLLDPIDPVKYDFALFGMGVHSEL